MGDILDYAKILSDYEAAQAKSRLVLGDAQQRQAGAAANIYNTQSRVALTGPETSARSAAVGDQMANIQPFSWTGDTSMSGNIPIPQSTGGLTPANFGPATRKAGADLAALSANRVSDPSFNIPKPPVLAPLPEPNRMDSILSHAGLLASLAKAAGVGSGSGGDLAKAAAAIKSLFSHGKTPDDGSRPSNDPNPDGFDFSSLFDDGSRPSNDPNPDGFETPHGSVSTDTTFNGVPGGYPNNPEDPMSADPEWWKQFDSGGETPDGQGVNGYAGWNF